MEWWRALVLRSAREWRADPIELLLAELMATCCALRNLFHATALAGAEGKQLLPRFRAEDSRPSRTPRIDNKPASYCSLKMSASSFNRRPRFPAGKAEGLTLASRPLSLGAWKCV